MIGLWGIWGHSLCCDPYCYAWLIIIDKGIELRGRHTSVFKTNCGGKMSREMYGQWWFLLGVLLFVFEFSKNLKIGIVMISRLHEKAYIVSLMFRFGGEPQKA